MGRGGSRKKGGRGVRTLAAFMIAVLGGLSGAPAMWAEPTAIVKTVALGMPGQVKAKPEREAKLKHFVGEVLSVDQRGQTVTVRIMVQDRPRDVTLGVQGELVTLLPQLKIGQRVRVTYHEVDGKPVAYGITSSRHGNRRR
jgi:hypothetical protein